ncbi:MAG: hypothetical protein Q9187_007929 [Circinaria calcarea]
MRIACLQFSPRLGRIPENIAKANALLEAADTANLDLLVLPELAFTGYNFPSLAAISPYLEPTAAGPTTTWAISTASRLNCIVSVGYPETTTITPSPGSSSSQTPPPRINYNSTITVSPSGQILAHYRKTHLYCTDEPWASESDTGWLTTILPFLTSTQSRLDALKMTQPPHTSLEIGNGVRTTFGICMDLNPHRFVSPWTDYEFASHALSTHASLIILSTAWTTTLPDENLSSLAKQPDLSTLSYWLSRLKPLIDADDGVERIAVIGNRTGREGEVGYAGTSVVVGVGGRRTWIWGILGRGEEGMLVVDTEEEARWVVQTREREGESEGEME